MNKREILIQQLKNHGASGIETLSTQDLQIKFNEVFGEFVRKMVAFSTDEKEGIKEDLAQVDGKIKDVLKETQNIGDYYAIFEDLLKRFSFQSISDVALNSIPPHLNESAMFILEIKYRQFQEEIIELIEAKIDFMPKEEKAQFMNFIEKNRDEMDLLKTILHQLENTHIAQKINAISNLKKYILSNFLPKDLEKNYRYFFNASSQKQELIARLREISGAYSKEQLDDMTKEDLIEILNSIRQKELDDKKDREDFEKYFDLFKRALYDDDSSEFNSLVIQVLECVSADCLANLKAKLKAQDALFEGKFQAAQKEWKNIKH